MHVRSLILNMYCITFFEGENFIIIYQICQKTVAPSDFEVFWLTLKVLSSKFLAEFSTSGLAVLATVIIFVGAEFFHEPLKVIKKIWLNLENIPLKGTYIAIAQNKYLANWWHWRQHI